MDIKNTTQTGGFAPATGRDEMTKYELLKETVGCRPIVFSSITCLEQDLYEAEKMLKLPYSLAVKDKDMGHYRKKVKHYKEIINDLELIASRCDKGEMR